MIFVVLRDSDVKLLPNSASKTLRKHGSPLCLGKVNALVTNGVDDEQKSGASVVRMSLGTSMTSGIGIDIGQWLITCCRSLLKKCMEESHRHPTLKYIVMHKITTAGDREPNNKISASWCSPTFSPYPQIDPTFVNVHDFSCHVFIQEPLRIITTQIIGSGSVPFGW